MNTREPVQLDYKTHILIGVRENGVMTVLRDWPHVPRQAEVLTLVGRGLSNKMIGRSLGLSEHTVRGHVQGLLSVLGVTRRAEAVFKAQQLGLIR